MRRRRHAGRGANPGPFLPLHRIWATSRRPSLPRLLNSARLHLGGRDPVEDGAIGAGATDLRAAGDAGSGGREAKSGGEEAGSGGRKA